MPIETTYPEQQLDEFGEPIPTEEELAQERADQEAARLAKTVAPPPMASPAPQPQMPDPVGAPAPVMPPQQPAAAPVQDPASLPVIDGNITPMPKAQESTSYPVYQPVSPPQSSKQRYPVKQMLNMGMKLNDVMKAVDASMRYQAQLSYQADLAKGMPQTEALAKWAPMLFSGSKGMVPSVVKPMTENQRSLEAHRKALEAQAAKRVVAPPRNMVLEKAIADERAALNKTRAELVKKPATDGTDPRIRDANYHIKKLKELTAQYQQSQPATATGTTPAAAPVVAPPTESASASKGKLTKELAQEFLKQASGDKAKARQLARNAGYEF